MLEELHEGTTGVAEIVPTELENPHDRWGDTTWGWIVLDHPANVILAECATLPEAFEACAVLGVRAAKAPCGICGVVVDTDGVFPVRCSDHIGRKGA